MMHAPDIQQLMQSLTVWILPVLFAVTLHEAAHGWVAWKLGDNTAWMLGRVTFNPLKHIDPFGTIIMPALLLLGSGGRIMFGYAKPVPVNFGRLNNPRRDMVLVAAAGPMANVVLATVSAIAIHGVGLLPPVAAEWAARNLVNSVWLNLVLAVFNMLPLPPLDGGRVAVGLLPRSLALPLAGMERYGMFIILFAVFLLPILGEQLGFDLNVFSWLVGQPAMALMRMLFTAVGVA